jgi:hypothetical protein
MFISTRIRRHFLGVLVTGLSACSSSDPSSDPYQPYSDGQVTVIDAETSGVSTATGLPEEGCLTVADGTCVPVDRTGRYCETGSGPADVIVSGGEVIEIVCYENTSSASGPVTIVDGNLDGNLDIPQQASGGVLLIGQGTIRGNVTLDGNNVSLYGEGPNRSVIDGNLLVTGNNARVRGIRVTGNVVIELNTASIVLSDIEGNLDIRSNNTLSANNRVLGNLTVTGNNTTLVSNWVQGNLEDDGSNTICDGNRAFTDQDPSAPGTITVLGESIACP